MSNLPDNNDTVILELDRPRELRLGHKALKRFSAMTGCSMDKMDAALNNYETMSALIYLMLFQEDSTLTPERVDDLLDSVPVGKIVEKCSQAITAAFDDPEDPAPQAEAEPQKVQDHPPTSPGTGGQANAWPCLSESLSATGNA